MNVRKLDPIFSDPSKLTISIAAYNPAEEEFMPIIYPSNDHCVLPVVLWGSAIGAEAVYKNLSTRSYNFVNDFLRRYVRIVVLANTHHKPGLAEKIQKELNFFEEKLRFDKTELIEEDGGNYLFEVSDKWFVYPTTCTLLVDVITTANKDADPLQRLEEIFIPNEINKSLEDVLTKMYDGDLGFTYDFYIDSYAMATNVGLHFHGCMKNFSGTVSEKHTSFYTSPGIVRPKEYAEDKGCLFFIPDPKDSVPLPTKKHSKKTGPQPRPFAPTYPPKAVYYGVGVDSESLPEVKAEPDEEDI